MDSRVFQHNRGVPFHISTVGVSGKMCVQTEEVASLEMSELWQSSFLVAAKRALDITLSTLLLVLLLPLFLVLAVLVKLSSPGPLFYTWRVVGREGRRFNGYKFRSMCANADELKGQLEH